MIYRILIIILLVFPLNLLAENRENFFSNEKMIEVKRILFPCKNPPVILVEKMMDSLSIPFHKIENVNWKEYPYSPLVSFRIAHSGKEIYLQYIVNEKYIRAFYSKDEGSAPYKDSCVEFFIIPGENDTIYYNLELNCIGVGTFAGGPNRKERTRFGSDVMSKIRRASSLGNEGFETKVGEFEWKITVALPVELFSLNQLSPLSGRQVKANFYKCGDDLPEKHYLSWNKIGTEKPDFHRPEFFGTLCFE